MIGLELVRVGKAKGEIKQSHKKLIADLNIGYVYCTETKLLVYGEELQ